MAPDSYTNNSMLTVTGNETCGSVMTYYHKPAIKKETGIEKRTRLALEKNRNSWFVFNEIKPTIKHIVKPKINYNKGHL